MSHAVEVLEAAPEEATKLPLLTEEERARVLIEWNDTRREFPRDASLWDLFLAVVERTPGAVALEMGGEEVTYTELARRAAALADQLIAAGVGPESPVALYCDRTAGLVVGMLGILKAGGFYIPLDPTHPRERQAWALENARAVALVTRAALEEKAPGGLPVVVMESPHPRPLSHEWERGAGYLEPQDLGTANPHPSPACGRGAEGEGLAYTIYTSGSTGRPKGVAVPQRGVARLVLNADHADLGPHIRMAQVATPAFDANTAEVWSVLLHGGCLVGIDREDLLDPRRLARSLREKRINFAVLTSAVFHQIAREEPGAFAAMEHLWIGGEPIDPTAARRVIEAGPPRRMVNGYGPTECTVFAVCGPIEEVAEDARSVPIGRAISNTTVRVLDPDLELTPVGAQGELYLGGDGLARCYLGRPDLTADRFVPDPYAEAPGERLYRTGDLVRWLPDGTIDFLGRIDDQVKIRGFRIEPAEIEAVLCAHPGVREAAVAPFEAGPGDRRLVAFVVGENSVAPEPAELRQALRERLPEPMVPSLFVIREALPLNPSGKVDRKALMAGMATVAFTTAEEAVAPPRTPQEEMLAGLWSEILGVPRVGIRDDFFDLGGHSLLVTRVLSRVREAFGVDLPPRSLFEARTVEGLAAHLAGATHTAETAPLVPARAETLPLSFAQQRLWIVERVGVPPGLYNIPVAWHIEGDIALDALTQALSGLVRRHKALRTVFVETAGEPAQKILGPEEVPLPVIDLRAAADPEAEARALCREEARRGFDLAHGPLLRALLLLTSDDRQILLINVHHIAADGWSMRVLAEDLSALYAAALSGERPALPPLPVHYADYALWQRQQLRGPELERLLEYWRERLAGLETLDLPTDRPRPETQGFAGAVCRQPLPEGTGERLATVARQLGATRFMTGLAAFVALLARSTGSRDVAVAAAVANRGRLEIERLIGFFVNTLVLRHDLEGTPSFAQIVRQVRDTLLEATAHQDLPFERLVEELRPDRRLGHMPLARVTFVLEERDPVPALRLPDARTRGSSVPTDLAMLDLSATLADRGEELEIALDYATALFDRATVQRMAGHLAILLQAALEDPGRGLDELPLLTPGERGQLFHDWNDTRVPYRHETTLADLFGAAVERRPDSVALEMGEAEVTYGELRRRARRLARRLRAEGIGPDQVVAIFLERSAELIVSIVATIEAGGAYMTLDIEAPADRVAWLLEDSGARVLLTSQDLAARLPSGDIPGLHRIEVDSLDDDGAAEPPLPPSGASAAHLAALFYTSGSTGKPKGVQLTHRGIARLLLDQDHYCVTPDDRVSHACNVSFDPSILEIWGTLVHGARLVWLDRRALLSPQRLEKTIQENRLTILLLPTALVHQTAAERPGAFRTLRTLMTGGEALEARAVRGILAAEPPGEILNCYGPTESTTTATWLRVEEAPEGTASVSIGRPIDNTSAWVVDRWYQPAPVGVAGELWLGGDGLARGYRGRPDLTAERFVPDPFSGEPGARLYRTGDLARWSPGGRLEFLGRTDHQVKIRGFRVEPEEIGHVLAEHPAVREAVVVPYEHRPGDKRLAAYVTPSGDEPLDPAALREHLKSRLPEFMVPSAIVPLEALPLTSRHKVDLKRLPHPELVPGAGAARVEPQTDAEKKVAAIWCDLLGLERVGVEDNFFDLGGHSLLLTRIEARLREAFDRDLSLIDLFRHPDIRTLARFLEGDGEETKAENGETRAEKMRTGRDRLRERGMKRRGR